MIAIANRERRILEALVRAHSLLRDGNPHHDAEGKFTSAGGEGGPGHGHRKRKKKRKKKRKLHEFAPHELGDSHTGTGWRRTEIRRRESRPRHWDDKNDPNPRRVTKASFRLQEIYDSHPLWTSPSFRSPEGEVGRVQVTKNAWHLSTKGEKAYYVQEHWTSQKYGEYDADAINTNDYQRAVVAAKKWSMRMHNESELEQIERSQRILYALERAHSLLRAQEGNPHHDAEGKFTSASGEGHAQPHGKHHARRQRRKARRKQRAEAVRREYKQAAKELKASHRQERADHVKGEHKDRAEKRRDQAKERKATAREHARERTAQAKGHAKEKAKWAKKWDKAKAKVEKEHGKASAKLDKAKSSRVPELRDRLAKRTEARLERIKQGPERLAAHQAKQVKGLAKRQKRELKEQRAEHADEMASLREDQAGERVSLKERHKEERQDLVERYEADIEEHGYRRRKKQQTGESRALSPGLAIHRQAPPSRTHKASSAESILRHVLRRRGWTAAFRRGELTDRQHRTLLEDVRQYAREWMRHEAEVLFAAYGREVERALSDTLAHHVGRWFGRAKQFVREAILAGAMALHGTAPLTAADLAEVDAQAEKQVAYLDKFQLDAHYKTPAEIGEGEPALTPMTAAQFVARAEMYGDAPWAAAQQVARARMVRGRAYTEERRIHGRLLDDMCQTCRESVQAGWVPIGTLPPIGDSECIGNCHCYFQYRDENGNVATTVRPMRGRKAMLKRRPVLAT